MKIKIRIPDMEFSADINERKAREVFEKAIKMLTEKETSEIKEGKEEQTRKGYFGFIYAKCESCGKERGFNAKEPIEAYKCECGHETHLEGMRMMYVNCECGGKYRYLTNVKDEEFDVQCINCGSPVAEYWNEKKQCYMSMRRS